MSLKPHPKEANASEEEKHPQNASPDTPNQRSLRRHIPQWIIVAIDSQKLRRESCGFFLRLKPANLSRAVPIFFFVSHIRYLDPSQSNSPAA